MTEPSWKPLFRTPQATITKVLHSHSFENSRQQARLILEEASALRVLADRVQAIDKVDAPLSAISDRVDAAVRFLHAHADRLDPPSGHGADDGSPADDPSPAARAAGVISAARERLVVAALHYLVPKIDVVPDFRAGGYIDDVMLLSWVFGAAADELEPFLDEAEALRR